MVTALNVSTTPSRSNVCSAGAAIGASVKTKASIVPMSGAIMPAPLAKPLMVTVVPPSRACAVASLGNVSVVMIGAGGVGIAVGGGLDGKFRQHAVESLCRQRLADDPGRSKKHFCRLAADRRGRKFCGKRTSRAAGFAGEGVGIAGIDDERAGARRPSAWRGTIRPAPMGIWSG